MKTTIPPTITTKNRTETKFKSAVGIAVQLLNWASMNRPPWRHGFVLITLILVCFALAPQAQAVCQRGCDLANNNTFLGDDALVNNTTGSFNTANGSHALLANTIGIDNTASGVNALGSNTTGSANTATGVEALFSNTIGGNNTAIGVVALWSNTTGDGNTAIGVAALQANTSGIENTATGAFALTANTTGSDNTATGLGALNSNTTGGGNTATGAVALGANTTGGGNTAIGNVALQANTTGSENTATGAGALNANTTGFDNTATGLNALLSNTIGVANTATGQGALNASTTGGGNVADGHQALFSNTTGSGNIALGDSAGTNLTTGNNNIEIGNVGVAGESNTIRIGTQGTQTRTFVAGISVSAVNGPAVKINSNGRLGVAPSAARFKDEIKPMDRASEAIHALKPVTFRYKKEIDTERTPEFGLVAEDVEKVNPDLVARDDDGKPYTVRYDAVNAMLLNEFLKEHKKVEEQQTTIAELKSTVAEQRKDFEAISAQQHKEIQALTASLQEQASQIQKVTAQIEIGKFTTGRIHRRGHAPQMVLNNQ